MTHNGNSPISYETAVEHEIVADALRNVWLHLGEKDRLSEDRIVDSTLAVTVGFVRARKGAAAAADLLERMAGQMRKGN